MPLPAMQFMSTFGMTTLSQSDLIDAPVFAEPWHYSSAARKEAWAEAYRHTPHGQPVELT
jgi:hypothetical protein